MVEFLDGTLPGMDGEVRKQAQRLLEKQGMTFKLSSKVTAVDASGPRLKATVEPAKGGAAETIEADVVLVSIGRVPYTDGLGLEEAGVKLDARGRVAVDAHYATNVPGIYAIGDVIAGPMLAHKAEDEGVAVAEILAGQAGHVNYDVIPNVVYTYPEIACVGKSEEELKAAGIAYNAGKFPFTANGRAKANQTTEGFVKILADAKTDRVLGVHIVCADAGNMIAEAGARHGIRRVGGRHRPHLPRPPDAARGGEGSGAGGGEALDSYVMLPAQKAFSGSEMAKGHKDKVAVITGGANGIGQAFAKRLAEDGVHVAIADLGDAGDTVKMVEAAGRQAIACQMRRRLRRLGRRHGGRGAGQIRPRRHPDQLRRHLSAEGLSSR